MGNAAAGRRVPLRRKVAGDVQDQLRESRRQRRPFLPLPLGTIAMFEVMAPSIAFSVETVGFCSGSGHNVK